MFARTRPAFAVLALLALSPLLMPATAQAQRTRPVAAEILLDAGTGTVLKANNADVVTYPASLTKMMTLLLTFEALDRGQFSLGQPLPVSVRATTMAPSRLGVAAGDSIRMEDAILALTTKSANDVAVVLAEALGGDEASFAQKMTKRARELGMKRTVFRNASGLPDREQRTTARDMAILSRALIRSHARHYPYFSRRSFDWQNETVYGHNRLLDQYDGMDGIKTGFIAASGFNLAASASRDGRRLIAVVLGGETAAKRDRRIVELMDIGFRSRAETARGPKSVAGSPKALAMAPASRTGDWGIQTGVFSNLETARQNAQAAHKRLGALADGATPTVQRAGELFKAQLIGFDAASALAACKRVKSAKGDCITVQPRP